MPVTRDAFYDAIIVGGGPAGLSAALLLGRACRRVVVIDAGHPRNAAAARLNGFLGRDGTSPHDLLLDARAQLAKYEVELVADEAIRAERLALTSERPYPTAFSIATKEDRWLSGRKLLFATGMQDELPNFAGVRECYGATIHHCPYCDGWEHQGERVLVYGKEVEKAVELGLDLKGWSTDVTVLTDGSSLNNEQKDRLAKNGIACAQQKIIRFVHHDDQLEGVELEGHGMLPAEAMFFHTHQRPGSHLPQALGVQRDETFSGRTNRKQKTNVPGLFIAGDADGDVQFVIIAAAEGATAAVAMNRELLDEDEQLRHTSGSSKAGTLVGTARH
jgi:thioredoxin reductase